MSFLVVHHAGDFVDFDTLAGAERSWGDSILFALRETVPFITPGADQQPTVTPSGPVQWIWFSVFSLLRFFSWALVALALASVTGLVRVRS